MNRSMKELSSYIEDKRAQIQAIRDDGRVIFDTLGRLLVEDLGDLEYDLSFGAYLYAALDYAFGTANDFVDHELSDANKEAVAQTFANATSGLQLSGAAISYDDFDDRYGRSPLLKLSFSEEIFSKLVLEEMQLKLAERITVTWDFRGGSAPALHLPYMMELELDDLETYHSLFKKAWPGPLFWARSLQTNAR